MSTCNWLDLQTLGSQPIMPKNLPDHCLKEHLWGKFCGELFEFLEWGFGKKHSWGVAGAIFAKNFLSFLSEGLEEYFWGICWSSFSGNLFEFFQWGLEGTFLGQTLWKAFWVSWVRVWKTVTGCCWSRFCEEFLEFLEFGSEEHIWGMVGVVFDLWRASWVSGVRAWRSGYVVSLEHFCG